MMLLLDDLAITERLFLSASQFEFMVTAPVVSLEFAPSPAPPLPPKSPPSPPSECAEKPNGVSRAQCCRRLPSDPAC
eukprot:6172400-Pleurochrysis_carterae.AAC.2